MLALAFAAIFPPFVGPNSLLNAFLQALTLATQLNGQYRISGILLILGVLGCLLIFVGLILALVLFSYGNRATWTRTVVLLSVVGMLVATVSLFDYSGDFISEIVTVTKVGFWPSLKFFGIGYFISWIMIALALYSSRKVPVSAVQEFKLPVAPSPTELIPMGYSALDNLLFGGLPVGAAVVLTGPPCDEKKLIVRRFLETNLRNGCPCILLTCSLDAVTDLIPKYRKELQVIICHPQAETIASNFDSIVKLKSVDSLTEINLEISKALARLPSGKRSVLCLDILDDVLLDHHERARRWLMDILGRGKSTRVTYLATLNPAMHSDQESQAVLETFDGHIELFEGEIQVRPKLIRVKKLAGRKFLDEELLVRRERIQE